MTSKPYVLVRVFIIQLLSCQLIKTSYQNDSDAPYNYVYGQEYTSVWFTFEFMLRFIVCADRLSFLKGTLNIVDMLAIVPFYFELCLSAIGFDTEKLEDFKGALLVVGYFY